MSLWVREKKKRKRKRKKKKMKIKETFSFETTFVCHKLFYLFLFFNNWNICFHSNAIYSQEEFFEVLWFFTKKVQELFFHNTSINVRSQIKKMLFLGTVLHKQTGGSFFICEWKDFLCNVKSDDNIWKGYSNSNKLRLC